MYLVTKLGRAMNTTTQLNHLQFYPSCCFYPTTVILLDDDKNLLLTLSSALLSSHYKPKSSTNPHEIITLLQQQGNLQENFIKNYVSIPEENLDLIKSTINVDVPSIQNEIYAQPPRFSQSIIVVVDYAMPDMDGLTFCQTIRHRLKLPIKFIMLTGEADLATAVKAFNDKSIDRFILKSSPDYVDTLIKYIRELHQDYFADLTHVALDASHVGKTPLTQNPEFLKLFNTFISQHNIIEYYMLEEPGSFLGLCAKKKPIRLIVKSEEDMQSLYEIAEGDRGTPKMVIDALKRKEKLAYHPNTDNKLAPAKDWHLIPAQKIEGQEPFYYGIIEDTEDYPMRLEEVVSYETFLNSK